MTTPKASVRRSPSLLVLQLHGRLATAPIAEPAGEVRRQLTTVIAAAATGRQAGLSLLGLAVVLLAAAMVLLIRPYDAGAPSLAAAAAVAAAAGMRQRAADQLRTLVTRITMAGPRGDESAYWRYFSTRAATASSYRGPLPTT